MKYFKYKLFPIGNGESIGPARYLPDDAITGWTDADGYIMYGAADIQNLNQIKRFSPTEITEAEFITVISPPVTGSI